MDSVLLIHSGGFTSRQWRKLADSLAPRYRVLTPNLLGYDAPWPISQPFHFREDVDYLLSLLDAPTHVVGHSYGGFLALQLALARPDRIRALALYEPVAFAVLTEAERAAIDQIGTYQPDAAGVDESWLGGFVDWWNGPGAWPHLSDDARTAFRAVGWKVSQEVASLATDRSDYTAITAPTLVLGGARTPEVERTVVTRLAERLPNATARILPDLGHMGPITHAALVNPLIAAHLDAY